MVECKGGRWFVRADGLFKLFPQNFERWDGADYFVPVTTGKASYRRESYGATAFLKWLRVRINGRDEGASLKKVERGYWEVHFER